MYTHTKFDHQFDHDISTRQAFFICSTPRCGSSLICEALCVAGAGVPTEYFDAETKAGFCQAWGIKNTSNYLAALLKKKTTPNGVFGCKTHWHQYVENFGANSIPDFSPLVKYIWLSRRDAVRQAVSYWKAIETNQWAVSHQCTNENPQFNLERVEELRKQNEFEEAQWKSFFEQNEIEPLHLHYEEFSQDTTAAVADCFEFLALDNSTIPSSLELTLERQSDDLSEQWVQQYLSLSQRV